VRTDDEINLWLAVNARPDDRLYRDILADWLEDHGRGYEAECLRALAGRRFVPTPADWHVETQWFAGQVSGNLQAAVWFLRLDGWTATKAGVWSVLCRAWSLCRRAGMDPRSGRADHKASRWRIQATLAINFALAEMPADKRWDEKEQRKAVSAVYPFGERRYHPYKIWLSEVKRRLGPTCRGRKVRTEERSLFEDAVA
jgi:uncharacterized protein (TIGR02996 family)